REVPGPTHPPPSPLHDAAGPRKVSPVKERFPSREETMIRQTLQRPVAICLGTAALLVVSIALVGSTPGASAQEKRNQAAPEAEKNAEERIRRISEQLVGGIEMEIRSDNEWTKVERIEKPLLFYTEPTRSNDR